MLISGSSCSKRRPWSQEEAEARLYVSSAMWTLMCTEPFPRRQAGKDGRVWGGGTGRLCVSDARRSQAWWPNTCIYSSMSGGQKPDPCSRGCTQGSRATPRLPGEPSPALSSFQGCHVPGAWPLPPRHSRQVAPSTSLTDPHTSLLRGSCEDTGSPGNPGSSPSQGPWLNLTCRVPLPREVSCAQVPGRGRGRPWGRRPASFGPLA